MPLTADRVIRTVLGDVPAQEWGVTNMHTHLVSDLYAPSADELYADFVLTGTEMAAEVDGFAAAGGFAIVECTPRGLGRDPAWMREASQRTGVRIVAGAGLYHERFHPLEVAGSTDAELTESFVREIEQGMDGTTVRAGIIGELGTDADRMTAAEERVFRAAARAALRTGVAVSTHTYLGGLAVEQLDVLEDEGLPAHRIVIGHLDDMPIIDLELCRLVAERGAYVQFDGAGCEYYSATMRAQMPTDAERLRAAAALVESGFGDRLLLASDICRRRHLRTEGGPGLAHHPGAFGSLAGSVLGAHTARTVFVDNPRTVLMLERAA